MEAKLDLPALAERIANTKLEFDFGTIFGGVVCQSGDFLLKVTSASATATTLMLELERDDGAKSKIEIHQPAGIEFFPPDKLVIHSATAIESYNRYLPVPGRQGPALLLRRSR